jgi:hypothetical protein
MKKLTLILSLSLALFLKVSSFASEPTKANHDVTFCIYSSAEAFNLTGVCQHLNQMGITHQVIAFGAARSELEKSDPTYLVALPENLKTLGYRGCWSEEAGLSKEQIESLYNLIKGSKLLVIGIRSKLQMELIQFFHARNLPVLGYCDSFDTLKGHTFLKSTLPYLQGLFLLTRSQKKELKELAPDLEGYAIGKDEIDQLMQKVTSRSENEATLQAIEAACAFDRSKKMLLYCSGDGLTSDAGFQLFYETMKDLRSKHYNIIVSLHPAPHATGAYEKALQKQLPRIQIAPKTISSAKLIEIADIVVTFGSSTLVNSIARKKASCYLVPSNSTFTNAPIQSGWVPCLRSPKEFWTWVVEGNSDVFDLRSELPKDSCCEMAKIISTYLSKTEKKLQK